MDKNLKKENLEKYFDFYNMTFSEKNIFEKLFNEYKIFFRNNFEDFFEENKGLNKRDFFDKIRFILKENKKI